MHSLKLTLYFMKTLFILILCCRECLLPSSPKTIRKSIRHLKDLLENELKLLCLNNSLTLCQTCKRLSNFALYTISSKSTLTTTSYRNVASKGEKNLIHYLCLKLMRRRKKDVQISLSY